MAASGLKLKPNTSNRRAFVILFLDFDGVLHPDPCYDTDQLFVHAPYLAATLEPFAEVSVVLSTSWRTSKPLDALIAPLPESLRERVVDITPDASSFRPPPHLLPYRRHAECMHWLETNRQLDQGWIAIDDRESWFAPECENLIVCNSQTGFDGTAACRLHAMLSLARERMLRGMDSFL